MSRRYGMRKNASRQEPRRPVVAAGSSRSPPCSRQISSARSSHGVDRVVGGLEAKRQQRATPVARADLRRLERVDEPAVRGLELGLGERADGLGAAEERVEAHRAPGAVDRPRPDPDPRLGDDAEDPLRAEQHPVGRGARARAGQAARHPVARRPDGADGLDEVVDVGQARGEVPARAGRDPAAEGRQLERLREEAQRQSRARRAAPRSAARSRPAPMRAARETLSISRTRVDRPEVDRDRRRRSGRARAARRRRRRSCRRRTG